MLTITEVAAASSVTSDTLRFYERSGLISPSGRTAANYRVYASDVVERVRFVRGAQRCGLRLQDIKVLLDVMDGGACACGHTAQLVTSRIEAIDVQLAALMEVRGRLVELAADSAGCRGLAADFFCGVAGCKEGGDAR